MAVRNIPKPIPGLKYGFYAAWDIIKHSSKEHIRMFLSNLKIAKQASEYLCLELDELEQEVELRLKALEDADKNVFYKKWQQQQRKRA